MTSELADKLNGLPTPVLESWDKTKTAPDVDWLHAEVRDANRKAH